MIEKIFRKIRSITKYNNFVVQRNQQQIIDHLQQSKSVFLQLLPPKGCGGNVEHYFHFLFDLVFPLFKIIKEIPSNSKFYLFEFGVLSKFIPELFGDQVVLVKRADKPTDIKVMPLIGMHPSCVPATLKQLDEFVHNIFHHFNIKRNHNPQKILLIERLPPEKYFLKDAKIKGAGASRRAITNHEELKAAIESAVLPSYEFQNVQLENMTLRQQVSVFNDAKIVIGQHGAGLGNMIWMNKNAIVVEINWISKPYFRDLTRKTGRVYFEKNYNESHIHIDVNDFIVWLQGIKDLRLYFKR